MLAGTVEAALEAGDATAYPNLLAAVNRHIAEVNRLKSCPQRERCLR